MFNFFNVLFFKEFMTTNFIRLKRFKINMICKMKKKIEKMANIFLEASPYSISQAAKINPT